MSGTRPTSPTPAEHHLGDRLAALVDGELGHDARERVLAHLATCARCKAEADAQRTVKSVFASAAPPPPSEGFLARLQGLPGGPGEPGGPGGPRGPLEGFLDAGGVKSDGFATAVVTPHPGAPGAGFRIHAVGHRPSGTSGRGRRFAFAAASAVSFAAIALGGTLPLEASVSASARGGQGTGSAVTPLRATATGGPSTGTATGGTSTTAIGGASTGTGVGRGTRSGERPGDSSVGAAEPRAAMAAVPPEPVVAPARGTASQGPVVAVAQSAVPQSLLALSPFVRPTTSALQLAFAPGPSPMASPTTGPLGSHR
ncbi:putative zinc finger protein [Streptomyces sp. PanSC19]|uniref:anti-sigma factor family protein n=1 Tax=Streptomyces sp. PanSC19 TaxID=1520455 RepID=UPI000F476563|nr:anti-sigma factor [Streptomyces sp. PanSC19]ROQ34200.1 putative zinc finger protein [Streptomyces sp. PanSC19]